MLITDGAGDAQSLNDACIISNAIFFYFILEEKGTFYVDSTHKLLDISLLYFL